MNSHVRGARVYIDLLIGVAVFFLGILLFLYATWLFIARLRAGERPAKSFKLWLRDLLDIVW